MFKITRGKGLAVPAILLFGLYVGYEFYSRHEAAEALREETLEDAIPTVAVVHPEPAEPSETITLPGTIDAWFEAPIYAQVSGYVKMWYKDYGAQVKEGDVLAEIKTPALDAQYEQAKADLAATRAKYNLAAVTAKRYTAMRANHAVSEQTITVQEYNAKAEEAKLKAAEQNVNNFAAKIKFKTIIAPYDGVVTSRNINVGDYINKEGYISDHNRVTNLFTVADIHRMRLFISVPGSFAHFLKPGLTADVTVPQFPNRHFEARFLTVAKGFDPNTRTVVTEFIIDNEDKALWPGSYATVRLTAPVDSNVLTIPSSALVFQEHGTEVATVSADNRIHFQPINVTRLLDQFIEVTGGVSKADRIVNNPSAALLEGDEVRIVTPAPGYELAAQASADPLPSTRKPAVN